MRINGIKVNGKEFAFDGCHKIYILETDQEKIEAIGLGYSLHPIKDIVMVYKNSCPLRFISTWALDKQYVEQGEEAEFDA